MESIIQFFFSKLYLLSNKVKQLFTILSLVIFFGFFSNSAAQVSITLAQFKAIFTPGQTHLFTNSDSSLQKVDVGGIGGLNVYDFSNVSLPSYGVSQNYYVSSIPNMMLRFPSDAITMGNLDLIERNPVFLFGQDTLFVLGQATNTSPEEYEHYVPYQIFGKFPLSYGYSFSQSLALYDTLFTSTGSINSIKSSAFENVTTVDGYGTLKINGYQFECLRIKMDHINFGDKEFIYLTREGIFVDIDVPSTEADTGTVRINRMMVLQASSLTDVKEVKTGVPTEYQLSQNYPNPFNPSTIINFQVPAYSHVTIKIFNILGKEIKTIVDENKPGGSYTVNFNAGSLASGIYFYRMQASASTGSATFMGTKKLILLK